jgi:predicted amidophosphoribosyltransferase
MHTNSIKTKDDRPRCAECGEVVVPIPGGVCELCKERLRQDDRIEYFEALSWEHEYNNGRRQ